MTHRRRHVDIPASLNTYPLALPRLGGLPRPLCPREEGSYLISSQATGVEDIMQVQALRLSGELRNYYA